MAGADEAYAPRGPHLDVRVGEPQLLLRLVQLGAALLQRVAQDCGRGAAARRPDLQSSSAPQRPARVSWGHQPPAHPTPARQQPLTDNVLVLAAELLRWQRGWWADGALLGCWAQVRAPRWTSVRCCCCTPGRRTGTLLHPPKAQAADNAQCSGRLTFCSVRISATACSAAFLSARTSFSSSLLRPSTCEKRQDEIHLKPSIHRGIAASEQAAWPLVRPRLWFGTRCSAGPRSDCPPPAPPTPAWPAPRSAPCPLRAAGWSPPGWPASGGRARQLGICSIAPRPAHSRGHGRRKGSLQARGEGPAQPAPARIACLGLVCQLGVFLLHHLDLRLQPRHLRGSIAIVFGPSSLTTRTCCKRAQLVQRLAHGTGAPM